MVILLESSKITMQVTNHFCYMENTQPHMVIIIIIIIIIQKSLYTVAYSVTYQYINYLQN